MKRLYFNIFAILLLVVSCQDTMEKAEKYPLAGKWVALDDDGSVSHYIEFKTGKYYRYESSKKQSCYYSDQTIWNPNRCRYKLVVEDWYSVSDGSLMIYDGQSFDVSTSPDGILKIGNQEYYPVKSFSSQYGFSLVLDEGYIIGYTSTEQEIVWNYQMGLPAGNRVDVQESADWIELVQVTDTQVKLRLAENPSMEKRYTPIVLSHPAVESMEVVLVQHMSGLVLVLASSTTSATYAGEVFEIPYAIENPGEGIDLIATTDVEWITDLSVKNGKLTFKVTENNSSSSRTGNIVLTYGTVQENHKVEQSFKGGLSFLESANCHVVSKEGTYKFKTVKGNSTNSVGAVFSASVLWESFGTDETPNAGDLVTNVEYEYGVIRFETPETFKEGNAVIAAKDASGKILWSWHIWLTDQPQGQVYYNNAGTMMDRNLGATSATPGDVGALGLLYQWGRKDPFLGSSSILSSTLAKSTITWPSAVSSNSSNGTIAYATANPTTFITRNTSNYDWYYTGSSSTDNTRWTTSESNKSIYDPCPAGWRVPDGGDNGVWSKACAENKWFYYSSNSTNEGLNFSGKFGSSSTIWYPASGHRSSDGSLYDVGDYGYYWSAFSSNYLYFKNYGEVYPSNYGGCASGKSVRCLHE